MAQMHLMVGKGQCFIITRLVVIYLTVLPDLDGDQSLSYFLHGFPEWQSGHTTGKQDGSVEWGVTSFMTAQHVCSTGNQCQLNTWSSTVSLHNHFCYLPSISNITVSSFIFHGKHKITAAVRADFVFLLFMTSSLFLVLDVCR